VEKSFLRFHIQKKCHEKENYASSCATSLVKQFGLERLIGGGLGGSASGSAGKSPWVPVMINGAGSRAALGRFLSGAINK